MRIVYSPNNYADLGAHVFPVGKYRRIAETLRVHDIPESAWITPDPATPRQLALVHSEEYLEDLRHCRHTARTQHSEMRLTPEIVDMFVLACGGTIEAGALALKEGLAVHIGGGFHHAFADRAEGFCYLNDLAICARELQSRGSIRTAMIVDCDLHQGNGTAKIFQNDASVFTFSIHQDDLYPVKEQSDLDVPLPNGTGDDAYLQLLTKHVPVILDRFRPDLLLYQAGADPYEHDTLGDLKLTMAGLRERDRRIIRWAGERAIPHAITLGGGYAAHPLDTVAIHVNTCLTAWQEWT